VTAALDSYTAADKAGITYRQLLWWIRQDYIHVARYTLTKNGPWPVDSGGSGTHIQLDDDELRVLLLMARMSRARFATREAARLARLSVTGNRSVLPLTAGTGLVLLVGPR
jgi:hypothetical protein